MKPLLFASLLCLMAAVGCSHANTVQVAEPSGGPPNLVWCTKTQDCFESAARMCDTTMGDSFSGNSSKPGQGRWHQVAETGMAFPALVSDGKGWTMHFRCDS